MFRFCDNFKSYCDGGVLVIVGTALFTPPTSGVAAPPGYNQFLGSTSIDLANKQSRYHLHNTFLGYVIP